MRELTRLFNASDEAVRIYVDQLARHVSHWELDPPEWTGKTNSQRALLFAKTSALMSGIPAIEMPPDGKWSKYDDASPEILEFFQNDHVLAEACMYGTPHEGRIIPPQVLNASLCRDKMRIRWRTGNDVMTDSDISSGMHTQKLIGLWMKTAFDGARMFKNLSDGDKSAFAWAMHHSLFCIKPFSTGNSRTARLCLQMCRNVVGLKPIAYRPADRDKLRMHLEHFRHAIFIPTMQSLDYMPKSA